jgi:hypothetical protein
MKRLRGSCHPLPLPLLLLLLLSAVAGLTLTACDLSAFRTGNQLAEGLGADGGGAGGGCVEEPDLPYDIKIQCGDPVIPVLAAFREKNGDQLIFAPVPGTSSACPFVIEDATIRADEVASCAPFTATVADARAQGNKDTGRDRVWVTWCWYRGATAAEADGACCVAAGGEDDIECETDHLDIRFSCDGGQGVPPGADRPLDADAVPATCDGGGGDSGDGCDQDVDTGSCDGGGGGDGGDDGDGGDGGDGGGGDGSHPVD